MLGGRQGTITLGKSNAQKGDWRQSNTQNPQLNTLQYSEGKASKTIPSQNISFASDNEPQIDFDDDIPF